MRVRIAGSAVLVGLTSALVGLSQGPPGAGTHTHRDGFSGKEPLFAQADTNVSVAVKDHRVTTDRYFNAPSSEYLKIEAKPAGKTVDGEFAHYSYETPPAPVAEGTTARVWIKAFRPGIRVKARVVLPKEKDPTNPELPLTTLLPGDEYREENVRTWAALSVKEPADLLRKQLPVLTARVGHQADPSGAYIDRIVLNVYAGPGVTELWIDDLEVGPCKADPARATGRRSPAATVGRTGTAHPFAVEFQGGKILIDKKPFFMRMIRHTDTGSEGLLRLREAKFNTVYFPAEADAALIDEAVTKHQFMVAAGTPLADPTVTVGTGADREAEKLAEHFRRFRSGDGILMWDLGGGRTTEQLKAVSRTADALREYDPRRPRAVDLWDGYQYYSDYLDVIGTHRWPLFTSLELENYRQWLMQRKALTSPGKLLWTWVQTHMPEWYTALATGQTNPDALESPLGPQPEQIRLLTYLSLAAGCRGLGFWSDRYLAQSHFGRDRLIELFLLNCELELLEPVLHAVEDEKTEWRETSHHHVMAAVLRGKKGIIVLPVWVGPGSQHCPDQAALSELKILVPMVPEGMDPWLLTPASYHNLRGTGGVKVVPPGLEITIPQFDMTAAVVFTADTAADGLVVRWQDNIRHVFGRKAAEYARDQANEEYAKVLAVHEKLVSVAPVVEGADDLFKESRKNLRQAERYLDNQQPDLAYREARRASRPLRVLMRAHWQQATAGLSVPTASPYAVSFFTLPQHWELANRMQSAKPGANALPHGGFELNTAAPESGAAVESLPGWSIRKTTLDPVTMSASIVNATDLADKPRELPPDVQRPGQVVGRYSSSRIEALRQPTGRAPNLGNHALRLFVNAKPGKPAKPGDKPEPVKIGALERTFVAVDSPTVEFAPGTWVRIGFWARCGTVQASPDGVLVFDSAGGEPLAVRFKDTVDFGVKPDRPAVMWKEFHFYRQVPASGKLGVTLALTGVGAVWFDDVRMEPVLAR